MERERLNMTICVHCSFDRLKDGAQYCTKCGLPQGQNPQPTTTPHSRIFIGVLVIAIAIAVIFTFILLNGFNLLSPTFITIASSINQLLTGIAGLYVLLVLIFPKNFKEEITKLPKTTFWILSILIIFILVSIPTASWYEANSLVPPSLCSLKPSLTTSKLGASFKQPIPDYNNPDGVVWYIHKNTNALPCIYGKTSGLLIQQMSDKFYGEVDLQLVNHKTYSLSDFSVQTQVKFIKPDDPNSGATFAGLLVQTPAPPSLAGGYDFLVNSNGQWQLKNWREGAAKDTIDNLVASDFVKLNVQQPVILQIRVHKGTLFALINGEVVTTQPDTIQKKTELWSREVALEIEFPPISPPSVPVLFSNFELN